MKNKTIVLIDDSSFIRTAFSAILENEGFVVEGFSNPKDALSYFKDNSPVCIITDYEMPEMNGEEFIKEFRSCEKNGHIPIVVLSMHDSDDKILTCLAAGADDYLPKRANPEVILSKVKVIVELSYAREKQSLIEQEELYQALITTLNHEFNNIITILIPLLDDGFSLDKFENEKRKILSKSCMKLVELIKAFQSINTPELISDPAYDKLIKLIKK